MTREVKVTLFKAILPTLPAIIGTGFFFAGVIEAKLSPISQAPPVRFHLSFVELIAMYAAVTLYGACYFGATLGPFLLPLAGYQAFSLTRQAGLRSRNAIWAWIFVVLGVAATAIFWGWLQFQDIWI